MRPCLAGSIYPLLRKGTVKSVVVLAVKSSRAHFACINARTLLYQSKVRALILFGSSGPKHQVTKPPENPELSQTEKFVVETVWQTPYDVLGDLETIQVPTLILVGDKDPRLEAAHLMHTEIPKSTLMVMEGQGHEIESRFCVEKILNWLKDLPECTHKTS